MQMSCYVRLEHSHLSRCVEWWMTRAASQITPQFGLLRLSSGVIPEMSQIRERWGSAKNFLGSDCSFDFD